MKKRSLLLVELTSVTSRISCAFRWWPSRLYDVASSV